MSWRRNKSTLPKFNPSPGLVRLSYRLLLEDKLMVVVLLVGGIATDLVLAAIVVPAWTLGHITPDPTRGGPWGLVVYASALWSAAFLSVLTQGVVVAAAQIRCEGGGPDVRRALALAWSRRGPLAAWAALATVVALAMALLQRLGVAGLAARLLAGIAWSVATVFAVPILVAHGTGPADTVRRSAHVVREQLGTVVRSNIRLAVPWLALAFTTGIVAVGAAIAFAVGISTGQPALAVAAAPVMLVSGAALFFCMLVSAALSAYLDTLLYRYATGLPVPTIEPGDLPPAPAT